MATNPIGPHIPSLCKYSEEMKERNRQYVRKLALKIKECLESNEWFSVFIYFFLKCYAFHHLDCSEKCRSLISEQISEQISGSFFKK